MLIRAVAALTAADLLLVGAGDGPPRFVAGLEQLARKTVLMVVVDCIGSNDMPAHSCWQM